MSGFSVLRREMRDALRGCAFAVFAVTTTADSGPGSFRQALLNANAGAGTDSIVVNIAAPPVFSVHTVNVLSPLPAISGPVNIDCGGVGDGTLFLALNGTAAGARAHGVTLAAGSGGSVLKRLKANLFAGHGFMLLSGNHQFDYCWAGQNGFDGVAVFSSGNLLARCEISHNDQHGIDLYGAGATLNTIVDCSSAGNALDGVAVQAGANGNSIGVGAPLPAGGNVITSNGRYGVGVIDGSYIVIRGNQIGGSPEDSGNVGDGIAVLGPSHHIDIGGTAAGAGNAISRGKSHGIRLENAKSCQVLGNKIGLGSGGALRPNALDGIAIVGGESHQVGGTAAGAANTLVGNYARGLSIRSGAKLITVQKNYIGVDQYDTYGVGNGWDGITVTGNCTGCYFADNYISANLGAGVRVTAGSNYCTFVRNIIGVGQSVAAGNQQGGVVISAGANNIAFGGPTAADGNVVAFNITGGIFLPNSNPASASGANNRILANNIRSNENIPIDLGSAGPDLTDYLDGDVGANGLTNRPQLSNAAQSFNTLTVNGVLNAKPNTKYRIEYYLKRPMTIATTRYLGATSEVTTNASGAVNFTKAIALPVGVGPRFVTATATGPEGTSEESAERGW